mmetsp:Transcript_109724/g.190071  ORF Transcript_109724/g.190071 Transcript_109724/m.190071 type:complete len:309 (+) Transcript_109724:1558-2484(+)
MVGAVGLLVDEFPRGGWSSGDCMGLGPAEVCGGLCKEVPEVAGTVATKEELKNEELETVGEVPGRCRGLPRGCEDEGVSWGGEAASARADVADVAGPGAWSTVSSGDAPWPLVNEGEAALELVGVGSVTPREGGGPMGCPGLGGSCVAGSEVRGLSGCGSLSCRWISCTMEDSLYGTWVCLEILTSTSSISCSRVGGASAGPAAATVGLALRMRAYRAQRSCFKIVMKSMSWFCTRELSTLTTCCCRSTSNFLASACCSLIAHAAISSFFDLRSFELASSWSNILRTAFNSSDLLSIANSSRPRASIS